MKLKQVFYSLILLTLTLPALTASARLRLIRSSHYTYDTTGFVLRDSFMYSYTGYRSGNMFNSTNGWAYAGNYDTAFLLLKNGHSGKYFMQSRTIKSYDTNSNMLTQLFQRYDTLHKTWQNSTLTINTYDSHNNLAANISQYWNTAAASWQNTSKTVKTYDAANNNISDTTSYWVSGAWQYNVADSYSYDAHNNLLVTQMLAYVGSTWLNANKTRNFLNAGSLPDSIISYMWNSTTTSYVYYTKQSFTYDASYNPLTDTNSLWNTATNSWIYNQVYLYTYSGTDPASKETINWVSGTGWKKHNKSNFTYDGNHNLLSNTTQNWNAYKTAYENANKITNTYNSDNKVTTNFTATWDTATNTWLPIYQLDQQNFYYYEPYTGLAVNNVGNTVAATLSLYPCPANSYITLELNNPDRKAVTMAIYDLNGKLYMQWEVQATDNYHATVPLNNLPSGNYLLEARTNNQQSVKQFSIVH